jgi:pimeloyl-ACP methyl ester carboxylesterase
MRPEIVRFANADRALVGALTLPEGASPRVGFVLCRPFGAEAIRSNMLFRTLAARLAQDGCAVLCFDYHGTGESPGEGSDQSMQAWQADIAAADAYLRRRTGVVRTHWFGLGLGASLAARAAFEAVTKTSRPAHLVLWEPVENGRAYAAQMCSHHRREMQRWFRARWHIICRDLGQTEPTLPGIVLGFEVGTVLARDLEQLDGLPTEALLNVGIGITAGQVVGTAPWGPSHRLHTIAIEQPVDWMTNHAADGEEYRSVPIVPTDAVQAARESLHATGPVLL